MHTYLAEDPLQSRSPGAGHPCLPDKAISGKKGQIAKGGGWQQQRYMNRHHKLKNPVKELHNVVCEHP